MNSTRLDQLPYLCLKRIFAFLNLRDLAQCRAVNRQFKFYAEEEAVDELTVSDKRTWCSEWCKHWYQTGRPIDHGNSIRWRAFASANSSPFKLDQQLKFLNLDLSHENCLDFEILNTFKQLVHLGSHMRPCHCGV